MVRGPCPDCHPSGVVSLVLQNLLGVVWNPSGHTSCGPASAGRLRWFHAMSFPGSLSWSEVVVSFTFVTGFVAITQAPPLLLGWRDLLYRPNQRETVAMGDCYILCGRSRVTWSAWATHRQQCEWFPFAARCNRKELSKTTVSF